MYLYILDASPLSDIFVGDILSLSVTGLLFFVMVSFKEDTSLKSWIVQIAKNTAINQYNKNKKSNTTLDFDYIMNLESETPTDFDELIKEFRQYLTIQESNIILFRVYYDMKLKDIAEYYETSINDIYLIYQKAIKTLKKHYKKGDF